MLTPSVVTGSMQLISYTLHDCVRRAVGSTVMFMRHNNKRLVFQRSGFEDNDVLAGPFTQGQIRVAIESAMREEDRIAVLPDDFHSREAMRGL